MYEKLSLIEENCIKKKKNLPLGKPCLCVDDKMWRVTVQQAQHSD